MDIKPLFAYRSGNSLIHKMPALIKLILLFLLPAAVFFIPPLYCFFYIFINSAAAFYAGFSLRRQIKDLKPIAYYAFFLALTHIVSFLIGESGSVKPLIALILRLTCAIQISSLFFSTTTSLELKQALEKVLPKSISLIFTLFLTFIPLLFSVWAQLDLSWKARAGKNGPKKLFVLFPVFISTALFKAQNLFYALQNRN
ncbi:hypothetical protein H0R92_08690 [Treponema sp. OMZ 840]|uniref:CbiQ family ECF transporter T component n=1 Tax=Treponema sp. OMZ 840 TaxID=244313 RepID=UPI003D94FE55